VLVGGDFNSKSRFVGPNDIDFADLAPGGPADEHARYVLLYQGQSVPEIGVLQRRLRDAREEAAADPGRYSHPGGWPVDHLFHRGAFAGSVYASLPESIYAPSDHAMVRFELMRTKVPSP
jgi:endonuclease/exonuclease/phosphatase (EEP) superfamily protein YafD